MASIINSTTTAGVTVTGDNSGSLQLATNNGTTAVTIDTSQNVGIGTTAPQQRLGVKPATNVPQLYLMQDNVANDGWKMFADSSNGDLEFFRTTTGTDTEYARITFAGLFKFNSGYGSVATAFGCRAWVNFNGTGTPAIRASGNVSSITDNGTSDYTINFTTAMPDANYAVCSIGYHKSAVTEGSMVAFQGSQASGSVQIQYRGNAGSPDPETIQITVTR